MASMSRSSVCTQQEETEHERKEEEHKEHKMRWKQESKNEKNSYSCCALKKNKE